MTDWQTALAPVKATEDYQHLLNRVAQRRAAGVAVYPPEPQIFAALALTPLPEVKVVILGQDPYHGPGQAHGLAFSVPEGVRVPPSLRNIYKELAASVPDFSVPGHGNLSHWARQGVLLLNTVLTVEQGKAHAHANWGWEKLTDAIIQTVSERGNNVVFMLWGSHAQKKAALVNDNGHLILSAPHPSPLSAHRGFLGCNHFVTANAYLTSQGKTAIDWRLPEGQGDLFG